MRFRKEMFGNPGQRALAAEIMKKALRVLHAPGGQPLPRVDESTLFLGVPARAESLASDSVPLDAARECALAFGARHMGLDDPIPEGAKTAVVILHRHPDLERAVNAACRLAKSGKKVIAVSMNVPYYLNGLPDTVWQAAAWQYDTLSLSALIDMLRAE